MSECKFNVGDIVVFQNENNDLPNFGNYNVLGGSGINGTLLKNGDLFEVTSIGYYDSDEEEGENEMNEEDEPNSKVVAGIEVSRLSDGKKIWWTFHEDEFVAHNGLFGDSSAVDKGKFFN